MLLNPEGMSINGHFVSWSGIRDTAILRMKVGKNKSDYLVTWLRDERYLLTDLGCFVRFRVGGIRGELAAYIEYFRAKAT
ncbi:hypothetical protein GCM10023184_42160 [Flaviaesturariibacter amylovorans]|uniref:Uncharacterized protein n=1 Tax=Flaviaesturariibacter amylovorans TaxID=1084520 RepID=A0ABP8HQ81_9BACT